MNANEKDDIESGTSPDTTTEVHIAGGADTPKEAFDGWWEHAEKVLFDPNAKVTDHQKLHLKSMMFSSFVTGISWAAATPPKIWINYLDDLAKRWTKPPGNEGASEEVVSQPM